MRILLDSTEQSLKGFRSMLKHLPDAMDDTYSMLWDRILKRKGLGPALAIRIFTWVIYAKGPISMRALRQGLYAEEPPKSFPFSEDDLTPTRAILSVCIGLIAERSRDSNVGFVHNTAEQYFKRHPPQHEDVAHFVIARACMNYLLLTSRMLFSAPEYSTRIETDDPDTQEVYDDSLGIYAGLRWGAHAETVQTKREVAPLIQRFLSDQACVSRSASVIIDHLYLSWNTAFIQTPYNSADVRGLHLAAFYGLNHAIKALLLLHPNEVSNGIDGFWTPLRCAGLNGKLGTVDFLESMGADLAQKDCRGNTTLMWLLALPFNERVMENVVINNTHVQCGDTITLSLWSFLTGDWQHLDQPMIPIHILEHLARITPQVDVKGHLGRTALSRAAEARVETVVKILLQRGADSSLLDDSGMNPLLWALQPPTAQRQHFKNFSINGKADVRLGDRLILYTENESTESMVKTRAAAVEAVCIPMIRPQQTFILQLETRDRSGRTALSLAAGQGLGRVVHRLLTLDADADTADDEGFTPLAWALAPPYLAMNSTFSNCSVGDEARVHLGTLMYFSCSSKTLEHHRSQRYDLNLKAYTMIHLLLAIKDLDQHLCPMSCGPNDAPMRVDQHFSSTAYEPGFMYLCDLAAFDAMSCVVGTLENTARKLGHDLHNGMCFRVARIQRTGHSYTGTLARDDARIHYGDAFEFKYGEANKSLEPQFALLRGKYQI